MNNVTKQCLYDICVKQNDLLIVDVMNHLFRFLWANRELSTVIDGEERATGHIYGFLRFVLLLKDRFPDCSIVLAFDGYDEERRTVSSEYKGGRANHDNIYRDIDDLRDMCSLIDGVYSCYDPKYEADDMINVVSHMVKRLCNSKSIKKNIYVISNDKDMYQLVDDTGFAQIKIIRKFGSGSAWWDEAEIIDTEKVKETFNGVEPKDLVKFRAITGDSSDNLKGYYRFRKKDAAIIAENYDYDTENKVLNLKEGVSPQASWKRFLTKVFDDMDIFDRNYRIMKMKNFEFEMDPVSYNGFTKDIGYIVATARKYGMNQYLQKICIGGYSKYRTEVARNM